MPIGNLEQANSAMQQGFRYSLLSKDIRQQMINKSYLGTVLHRKGKLTDAYVCFQEARKLQRKRGYDELYSLSGFWHCSLLLDTVIDEYDLKKIIVLKTKQSNELKTATPLNDLAYNLLTIASAYLALNEMSHAGDAFKQAVQQIQKSNMIHCIPPFYLLRANFYLISDQLDLAKADLETVLEIIECYSMHLYAVDYLLIHGRYCLDINDHDAALENYEEAKNLIQETGYHLRDAEQDLLAAMICQQHGTIEGC